MVAASATLRVRSIHPDPSQLYPQQNVEFECYCFTGQWLNTTRSQYQAKFTYTKLQGRSYDTHDPGRKAFVIILPNTDLRWSHAGLVVEAFKTWVREPRALHQPLAICRYYLLECLLFRSWASHRFYLKLGRKSGEILITGAKMVCVLSPTTGPCIDSPWRIEYAASIVPMGCVYGIGRQGLYHPSMAVCHAWVSHGWAWGIPNRTLKAMSHQRADFPSYRPTCTAIYLFTKQVWDWECLISKLQVGFSHIRYSWNYLTKIKLR